MTLGKMTKAVFTTVALGLVCATAQARTFGAQAGKQPFLGNNAAACFHLADGSAQNICDERFNWDVVLPIDEPGVYKPRIYYKEDPISPPMKCAALTVSSEGAITGTPWVNVKYDGNSFVEPGEIEVPPGAVLMVACALGKGDIFRSIEY